MATIHRCPSCNASVSGKPGQEVSCTSCGNAVRLPGEPKHLPQPVVRAPIRRETEGDPFETPSALPGLLSVLVIIGLVGGLIWLLVGTITVDDDGGGSVAEGAAGDEGDEGDSVAVGGSTGAGTDPGAGGGAVDGVLGAVVVSPADAVGGRDDARFLDLTEHGELVLAEFDSRRVMLLDRDGSPIDGWTAAGVDLQINGTAVGGDGVLFVRHGFTVYRYDLTTGELLGEVDVDGAVGDRVVRDETRRPDGGVLLLGRENTLIWVTSDGQVERVVETGLDPFEDMLSHVAVGDGGQIYAIGSLDQEATLWVFSPEGVLDATVALEGFRTASFLDLDADADGRIVVAGFDTVVLDGAGRTLAGYDVPGASGVVLDADGVLWVTDRTDVWRVDGVPAPG